MKMRNLLTGVITGLATALVLSSFASAQAPQSQQETRAVAGWKYIPTDRAVGPGGPAPKRDLTGTWAGPRSGAGVPDNERSDKPVMTPLGQQLFEGNKPLGKFSPAGTNDPSVRYCDPFGFPRSAVAEIRGLSFATMPDRIVVLTQFFAVWREIWMDGRALPKNVGSTDKNSPDPRFNGYSVGHWEGDDTLVVDTTGLDERTWLSGAGYPHTMNAHVQERYTRTSHNDLHLTVTVDDPTLYTKPFVLSVSSFRWIPNQQLDEKMCVPSETIEYLKAVGDPAGSDPNAPAGVRY
jgi:hypothetical protein